MDEREQLAAGFARLSEILGRLIARAEILSTERCPYRNRRDECAAAFGCVNQRKSHPGGVAFCSGEVLESAGIRREA